MSSESRECVVVTGASTGIGAASARELARRGFHVLAGVRRDRDADTLRAPGIEPVILDITQPDHIADLAARVDSQAGALRALVNNAAISVNAPVEALPLEEWRRLFEVNLFGHVAVTQALLPTLLRHSGRVVNISSVGGKIAMATFGPYAGTKFALEAVSDALRRELAPQGVRVVVVEPGGIRTEMADRGIATTSRLAEAMSAGKPRTRYIIGRDAALLTRLSRILPDRMLDRIAAAALRPYYPKTTTA
jgi:NAD(P)-dependent dehydrogenase (short-subunit alcohol dehydrogenase family)